MTRYCELTHHSQQFHFVLGFRKPMLVPRNVIPSLAEFVELAFLRDMDEVWNLSGTVKNILRDSV